MEELLVCVSLVAQDKIFLHIPIPENTGPDSLMALPVCSVNPPSFLS